MTGDSNNPPSTESASTPNSSNSATNNGARVDSASSRGTTFIVRRPIYKIQRTKIIDSENPSNDTSDVPDVVSPQLLLKYFNKQNDTNNFKANILEPLDLQPSHPTPTPGSKASYSNGP